MPFGSGSTMSTVRSSRPWPLDRRSAMPSRASTGWSMSRSGTKQRFKKGDISLADLNQVRIRLRTARLGLADAEAAYRKAKLDLGSLMNLKLEEIAQLELKGTISDVAPPPPPAEELRKLALAERPDIVSLRLGVQRAEADCPARQGQRVQ